MTAAFPEIVRAAADRTAKRGTATLLPDPPAEEIVCPIISVDDHVLEPPSLFDGRIPHGLEDYVPRLWYDDDQVPFWVFDGKAHGIVSMNGAAGRPVQEWTAAPQKFEEFRTGVVDSSARLADMDLCGIWASLCFSSISFGFAGSRLSLLSNPDAGLAALRAYNDWMLEDWCGVDLNRYIPCQLPWLRDPAIATAEILRNAARGFRAISFSENPENQAGPSIHSGEWDPFFAACQETNTVINLHVGSSGSVHVPSVHTPPEGREALFAMSGIMTVVDWIYSQVPVRFPDLQICLSEAGIGWLPMVAERLEKLHSRVAAADSWKRDYPSPAEILYHNFWFTSIDDRAVFRHLDAIPLNHVMVESDYPHTDTTWPHTQRTLRRMLSNADLSAITQICFENASRLYAQTPPPASWIARSYVGQIQGMA